MDKNLKAGLALLLLIIIAVAIWVAINPSVGLGVGTEWYQKHPENICYPQVYSTQGDEIVYSLPNNSTCVDGVIVPDSEIADTNNISYCEGYFYAVSAELVNGTWITNKTEIQGTNYCTDGIVYDSPDTCGNWQCDSNETEENCWFDCGVISSWDKMKIEENRPELQKYIEGSEIYDTSSEEVRKLNQLIVDKYDPKSPAEAVKYLVSELYQRVEYVPSSDPRNPQVGDTPDDILQRGFGNCVDYTVAMIASLRQGFVIDGELIKIPARQVGGCMSNGGWKAIPFKASDDRFNFQGRVIAHVWTEVWGGEINGRERWGMADPTSNVAIAKQWFGYFRVMDSDEIPVYYLPVEYNDFCQGY